MANAPCKDCPDRHIGCHSECDKFADYTIRQEQSRATARRRSIANGQLMAPEKLRNINKARKGR